MQRWDYAILNIVKSYGMNYRVNGDKQGQWKDQPIHVVFQQLGKVGFELVVYDGENYIFKRPSVASERQTDKAEPAAHADAQPEAHDQASE